MTIIIRGLKLAAFTMALLSVCGAGRASNRAKVDARAAVERSVAFLTKDALAWRAAHNCATCHHGVMTVWALNDAKRAGFAVDEKALNEMVQWSRAYAVPDPSKPVDHRPGYANVNLASLWLAAAAQTQSRLATVTDEDLGKVALHAAQRQGDDGSWFTDMPERARPPTFESRETLTLWALLALPPPNPNDTSSAAGNTRAKAIAWLARTTSDGTPQDLAHRLLAAVRGGASPSDYRDRIGRLEQKQNRDGGWSPIAGLPSDAYTTGLAVYALGLAGVLPREQQRAASYLVSTQRPDGSWPMTPRPGSGIEPCKNPAPIIHIGSAWATLGLIQVAQELR